MDNESEEMSWDDVFSDEDVRIISEADAERDKLYRKEAIVSAIQQRCEHSVNYNLNWLERWFYTFKAVVCVLINRREDLWAKDCVDCVSYWGYRGGYRDSWMQFAVGHGIFRNWHYDIYSNSSY